MATANGLRVFSMHATDEDEAARAIAVRDEVADANKAVGTFNPAALDPETVARKYAQQALVSPSVPAFDLVPAVRQQTNLKTIGTETVPLTQTKIVKFRQQVQNIPVYGSLVSVELDDQHNLVSLNSALGEPQQVDPVATVSPAHAAELALADAGEGATRSPAAPRLFMYYDAKTSKWRLVYIVQNVRTYPQRGQDVDGNLADYVVDAHTEEIVARHPRVYTVTKEEQATDLLGKTRQIWVEVTNNRRCLKDTLHNVATFDFKFGDTAQDDAPLPGDLICVQGQTTKFSAAGVSAQANATTMSIYLATVLHRNSVDDQGLTLKMSINCIDSTQQRPGGNPKVWRNAAWRPDLNQMVYGQVDNGGQLRSLASSLDVTAHEITHGVTAHTSDLIYQDESGAMNESYSDIFGTIVSNFPEPDVTKWNFEIGEDLENPPQPLRDMSNPARFGQPDKMSDFRHPVDEFGRPRDHGGVHTNSGIHNKAAFNVLMATLADGTRAFTPDQVSAMFYIALTQVLAPTSGFSDSRRGVISAARSLFRNDPQAVLDAKVAALGKAFSAVGIN